MKKYIIILVTLLIPTFFCSGCVATDTEIANSLDGNMTRLVYSVGYLDSISQTEMADLIQNTSYFGGVETLQNSNLGLSGLKENNFRTSVFSNPLTSINSSINRNFESPNTANFSSSNFNGENCSSYNQYGSTGIYGNNTNESANVLTGLANSSGDGLINNSNTNCNFCENCNYRNKNLTGNTLSSNNNFAGATNMYGGNLAGGSNTYNCYNGAGTCNTYNCNNLEGECNAYNCNTCAGGCNTKVYPNGNFNTNGENLNGNNTPCENYGIATLPLVDDEYPIANNVNTGNASANALGGLYETNGATSINGTQTGLNTSFNGQENINTLDGVGNLNSATTETITDENNQTSGLSGVVDTSLLLSSASDLNEILMLISQKRGIIMLYCTDLRAGKGTLTADSKEAITEYIAIIKETTNYLNTYSNTLTTYMNNIKTIAYTENAQELINAKLIRTNEILKTRYAKLDTCIDSLDAIISILQRSIGMDYASNYTLQTETQNVALNNGSALNNSTEIIESQGNILNNSTANLQSSQNLNSHNNELNSASKFLNGSTNLNYNENFTINPYSNNSNLSNNNCENNLSNSCGNYNNSVYPYCNNLSINKNYACDTINRTANNNHINDSFNTNVQNQNENTKILDEKFSSGNNLVSETNNIAGNNFGKEIKNSTIGSNLVVGINNTTAGNNFGKEIENNTVGSNFADGINNNVTGNNSNIESVLSGLPANTQPLILNQNPNQTTEDILNGYPTASPITSPNPTNIISSIEVSSSATDLMDEENTTQSIKELKEDETKIQNKIIDSNVVVMPQGDKLSLSENQKNSKNKELNLENNNIDSEKLHSKSNIKKNETKSEKTKDELNTKNNQNTTNIEKNIILVNDTKFANSDYFETSKTSSSLNENLQLENFDEKTTTEFINHISSTALPTIESDKIFSATTLLPVVKEQDTVKTLPYYPQFN